MFLVDERVERVAGQDPDNLGAINLCEGSMVLPDTLWWKPAVSPLPRAGKTPFAPRTTHRCRVKSAALLEHCPPSSRTRPGIRNITHRFPLFAAIKLFKDGSFSPTNPRDHTFQISILQLVGVKHHIDLTLSSCDLGDWCLGSLLLGCQAKAEGE